MGLVLLKEINLTNNEIKNIKISDIDFSNNEINLVNRRIKVDLKIIDILYKAYKEEYYIPNTENDDPIQLAATEYIIKETLEEDREFFLDERILSIENLM
jgi:hypothetical protein